MWHVAFALALFVLSTRSPLAGLSEENLSMHMMVQHPLNLIPGLILGRLAARWVVARAVGAVSAINLLGVVLAGMVLAVWHLPVSVEAAVRNDGVHALMHLSIFVLGGVPLGISVTNLGGLGRILLFTAAVPISLLGTIVPYSTPELYPSYAPWQHEQMAWLMMVAMPLVAIAVLVMSPFWASLVGLWRRHRLSEFGVVLISLALFTMLVLELAGAGHFHMLD